MKKFLSLVLALIMTMSLVTVSAGAKDFTDDESLNYEEAVAVMSEIGVIDGYTDGSFKPQNGLTRGAAAKIICNMILGPTTAAALRADTAPFKDVAVDNQYAGYIAYCVQQGITAGYTDGTYRPAAPLTSFAFMKMLLGALGYDQNTEGYVGGNCFINVAKQAIGIGLNAGLLEEFDGGKQITREEAALFAFNTLKATMVEYDQKTVVTVGNAEVALSGNLKDVSWTGYNNADGNIKADGKVQFAEKYFTKLVGKATEDAFGRPATAWAYNKDEVGTYVRNDLLVAEYTTEVEGGELFNVIGAKALEDFDLYAYIDGRDGDLDAIDSDNLTADAIADCAKQVDKVTYKKSEDTVLRTGNGVLTQVFVDLENEDIYVVSINTYLAFATADYNTAKETLSIEVFSYDFTTNDAQMHAGSDIVKLSGDDYDVEDYEEGDALLLTIANGEVQTIAEPEVKSDCTVTQFSTKKGDDDDSYTTKVTFDGESYTYNRTAQYDDEVLYTYDNKLLTDKTYNFFLDQYGYVIGAEEASSELQYLFITAVDYIYSNRVNATATATAIFPDGNIDNITVKVKATNDNIKEVSESDTGIYKQFSSANTVEDADPSASAWNTWYSYTVKDNVYTLAPVADQGQQTTDDAAAKINSSKSSLDDTEIADAPITAAAFGNSKSIYITVDTTAVNDVTAVKDVTSVTTGIKAVDLSVPTGVTPAEDDGDPVVAETRGVYFLWDSKDYVIAAIVVGDDNATTKNFVYLLDDDANYEKYDGDDYYWEFDAIVEGEESEIVELATTGWSKVEAAGEGLIRIAKNSDGYVVGAEDASGIAADTVVTDFTAIVRGDTKAVEMLDVTGEDDGLAVLFQKADTLYVNQVRSGNGLVMADDVEIVVIDNGDVDDSVANLKSALAAVDYDLDTDECQFVGDIVAILNSKGEAAVLILDATTPEAEEDEDEVDDTIVVAVANGTITVTAPEGTGTDAVATAIVAKLNKLGYSNVKVQVAEGAVAGATAEKNSIQYAFDIA